MIGIEPRAEYVVGSFLALAVFIARFQRITMPVSRLMSGPHP